jgi:hypothetical protein
VSAYRCIGVSAYRRISSSRRAGKRQFGLNPGGSFTILSRDCLPRPLSRSRNPQSRVRHIQRARRVSDPGNPGSGGASPYRAGDGPGSDGASPYRAGDGPGSWSSRLHRARALLFLRVSNDRNGRALWVLDHGEATHFGNITRRHNYLPAELFRLLCGAIGTIDCHIA